jgi:ferredoxin
VLDADLIINLPKLKTHELTLMTCGIKNMFGCVPGLNKVTYHMEAQAPEDFAEALIDLFEKIPPAITIADAVVSMEGAGPSNGELRTTQRIIASTDTVALDAICAHMMGFKEMEVPTIRIATSRGLGKGYLKDIEVLGEGLEIFKDFKKPSGKTSMITKIPKPLMKLLKPIIDNIKVRPKINRDKCIKCLMCVNSCPTKAIDPKSFKIDHKKCIMCLCCRELCKYNAVELEKSILWKLLNPERT